MCGESCTQRGLREPGEPLTYGSRRNQHMHEHPTIARVLFDESHSEAWTIRPELARRMQPAHPGDSSLARAAEALGAREFVVDANAQRPLTAETLSNTDVLVIPHPSDPKW